MCVCVYTHIHSIHNTIYMHSTDINSTDITFTPQIQSNAFKINIYYKVSKIRLNGSHIISENGIYCSM